MSLVSTAAGRVWRIWDRSRRSGEPQGSGEEEGPMKSPVLSVPSLGSESHSANRRSSWLLAQLLAGNVNTIAKGRWRLLTVIGGLLTVAALVLVACGGSSTPSGTAATPAKPTATAIPAAALMTSGSGVLWGCPLADTFTGTGGQDYQVVVTLGVCTNKAAVVGVAYDSTGGAVVWEGTALYAVPEGEVQATFAGNPSGYSLVIVFTAERIEKVILTVGTGAPAELQRK
jgi:hypothetical protein